MNSVPSSGGGSVDTNEFSSLDPDTTNWDAKEWGAIDWELISNYNFDGLCDDGIESAQQPDIFQPPLLQDELSNGIIPHGIPPSDSSAPFGLRRMSDLEQANRPELGPRHYVAPTTASNFEHSGQYDCALRLRTVRGEPNFKQTVNNWNGTDLNQHFGPCEHKPAIHRPLEIIEHNNDSSPLGSTGLEFHPSTETSLSTSSAGLNTPASNNSSLNASTTSLAPVLSQPSSDVLFPAKAARSRDYGQMRDVTTSPKDLSNQDEPDRKKHKGPNKVKLIGNRAEKVANPCTWCQLMKQKCNETDANEPCEKCENQMILRSNRKLWNIPCYRGNITDICTFRTGSLRFPNGVNIVRRWEGDKRTINLFFPVPIHIEKFQIGPKPVVTIQCKRHSKRKSDLLEKTYRVGDDITTINFPPYAVSDIPSANVALQKMVSDNLEYFINILFYESQEPITRITISEARRHQQSSMLQGTLKVAVITRLFSKSFGISGSETLGIAEVTDVRSPYFGRRPIPPMLDNQLDNIWRNLLKTESKMVLKALKEACKRHKREEWLLNFLTMFLLIQNIEYSYEHQCAQLLKSQKGSRDERAERYNQSMLDEWQQSAENIINHFLIVCHGQTPLKIALEKDGSLEPAALDSESQQYVVDLAHMVEQDRERLSKAATANGRTPFHWSARLLVPLPEPRVT